MDFDMCIFSPNTCVGCKLILLFRFTAKLKRFFEKLQEEYDIKWFISFNSRLMRQARICYTTNLNIATSAVQGHIYCFIV